jgi:hypothetical protein
LYTDREQLDKWKSQEQAEATTLYIEEDISDDDSSEDESGVEESGDEGSVSGGEDESGENSTTKKIVLAIVPCRRIIGPRGPRHCAQRRCLGLEEAFKTYVWSLTPFDPT